jgi:hypothetical protein
MVSFSSGRNRPARRTADTTIPDRLGRNPDVGKRWSQDNPTNIAPADDNWPQIEDKTPKELE